MYMATKKCMSYAFCLVPKILLKTISLYLHSQSNRRNINISGKPGNHFSGLGLAVLN